MYISVVGIMGSGKTTASSLIAEKLGFTFFQEKCEENKFLPLFYQEPRRWSLHSQLFYLHQRSHQLSKINVLLSKNNIVHDSSIYQDYFTYAKSQHMLGYMNHDEFNLYKKYFDFLKEGIPIPNLIVQLDVSIDTLIERIHNRNREYEMKIDKSYFELMSHFQNKWITTHPHLNILSINTDNLDLVSNHKHQKQFISSISKQLT